MSHHVSWVVGASDLPENLSAEQLEKVSPDERARAFRERIVTDEDAIPADFRETIYKRAKSLGNPMRYRAAAFTRRVRCAAR